MPLTLSIKRIHALIYSLLLAAVIPISLFSQTLPDEKKVNFTLPEVSLTEAITALSENTGVNITYTPQDIPQDLKVTIGAKHLPLGVVLDDILSFTDLKYDIIGSQLVIYKNPEAEIDKTIRIDGYVEDKTSGERLVFANVFTDDYAIGTYTNEYGYFSLDVPAGENVVLFSYLGYDKTIRYFNTSSDTTVSVTLNANILLNEVVIIADVPIEARQMEISDKIPIQKIQNLPALAGEPDIIRLASLRPGVVTPNDGFGGISIRGGSADQNLVLYDGVPVYNTGHALGIFSIFNSTVVKSANIIKGGFPARYGGRLSSVLDVRTREGNNKEFSGDISISPITARATIEGPIKKEKSSFIISARRTIVEPWLRPITESLYSINDEVGFINYYFLDFSAKLNMQIGEKDHIYFSGHLSDDDYSSQTTSFSNNQGQNIAESDKTDWKWGNKLGTIRWNHTYSNKAFSNLTLSYSKFDFDFFDFDKTVIGPDGGQQAIGYLASLYDSDITDLIGNLDFEYRIGPKWNLAVGSSFTRHNFRPGVIFSSTTDDLLGEKEFLEASDLAETFTPPNIIGSEVRSYLENDIQLTSWLDVNLGGHVSYISVDEGATFLSFQPRALVKIQMNESNTLKLSYTRMNQFLHLLSNAGIGLPNDVWVPSTADIPPQKSTQYSAELNVGVIKDWPITVSAYYKDLTNLRTFRDGSVFGIREGVDWEKELAEGTGTAYGAEFSIERQLGRYSGWFNYTWSKSERLYPELNLGMPFYTRFDRRHNINLSSLINLKENMELSFQWTYGTGTPYTSPTGKVENVVNGVVETTFLYGPRNNVRLQDYHRLDFALNMFKDYGWGKQKISIGAYNVYNRQNPFYVDFVTDPQDSDQIIAEAVSIFPIIPNVSYSLSF